MSKSEHEFTVVYQRTMGPLPSLSGEADWSNPGMMSYDVWIVPGEYDEEKYPDQQLHSSIEGAVPIALTVSGDEAYIAATGIIKVLQRIGVRVHFCVFES